VPTPNPRPHIRLTLDAEPPGGYSRLPWYALRENYFAAIARAAALPTRSAQSDELEAQTRRLKVWG